MKWLEITVITSQEAKEAVAEIMYRLGAIGLVIEDSVSPLPADEIEDYSPEVIVYAPLKDVLVTTYLPIDHTVLGTIESLKQQIVALSDFGLDPGLATVTIKEVQDEDWASSWKQYYRPQKIGKRLLIKPSWEEVAVDEGIVVVELDPGMAFGTGTHPTTIMCLEYLEALNLNDAKVLDLGTGSGILAITAALLGAVAVDALDFDPLAVRVAKENVLLNKVDDLVTVEQSDMFAKACGKYHVIVANIVARIIIAAVPKVKEYLHTGGVFIASGIIQDKLASVTETLVGNGLVVKQIKREGEWVALLIEIGDKSCA
ncbi:MAG: 50S ribosomal protein L11 methyltransferase [bacterium]|nr:50S ribosomal protein L11 methyltransferase [bacterium]